MRNRPRQVQRPSLWEDLWRMRYGKDEPEDAKYRARRERDFLEEYERRKQELLAQRLRMERLVEALEGELVGLTPRSIHIVRGMVERRGIQGAVDCLADPG